MPAGVVADCEYPRLVCTQPRVDRDGLRMDYAAGGWQQAPKRAFYVTNTQDCRGRGAH